MNVFGLLALTMLLIVVLLRKKVVLGLAMIGGGIFLWSLYSGDTQVLWGAITKTFVQHRTYDLAAALYLVMCLEIELRTSGTLTGMVSALRRLFSGSKATLMVMPAFLGLLPSLGGARFSAPIVEEASRDIGIDKDKQAAINFWFRHPFEFSNPIIPGMIMACSITGVSYADFARYTAWISVLAIFLGWLVLIRPLREENTAAKAQRKDEGEGSLFDVLLAVSPVIATLLLVLFGGYTASIAMGITTAGLFVLLKLIGRQVSLYEVITGAIDKKMFLNVGCILCFVNILNDTKVLAAVCDAFRAAPLPIPVIIAAISIVIGILTGLSQAHVAIVMPIVAAMGTGDLTLAAVAMIFGVAGQMLTPTHLCLVVTLDYFHADIFRALRPILLIEVLLLTVFSVVTYVRVM